jgi:hypothetical protein
MHRSNLFLLSTAIGLVLVALTALDAVVRPHLEADALAEREALVASLGLTDLALFTEARYTRHLSQADLHAPFQNHPGALEHFPSGTLAAPPRHLLR